LKCWRNLRLLRSSLNLRLGFIQISTTIFVVISKYSSSNVLFTIWTLIRFVTTQHQVLSDCWWRMLFVTKRTWNTLLQHRKSIFDIDQNHFEHVSISNLLFQS
jgi:hypothetical protein